MDVGAVEHAINNMTMLPKEAKKMVRDLASRWKKDEAGAKAIEVVKLKGAMTNDVYQINWFKDEDNENVSRKVLVRIYGKGAEIFFDREDEIRVFEFMSKHGQGPHLLGRFNSGRIEEFIHAKTLSASDIRDPEISARIAVRLKEFHENDMPGPKNMHIWGRMRKWLKSALDLCSREEVDEFLLSCMDKEINYLQNKLYKNHQQIGFCHNDLQYGNIMVDEETRSVTLIDYDYAGYNPIAYDIANHFCEMAADYHTDTPHRLDFDKYPDLEERKRFVHMYMSSPCGKQSDFVVDFLIGDIEKYTLASHLFWCLWGLISNHVNKNCFDYLEYARQRFRQYQLMKPILLEN